MATPLADRLRAAFGSSLRATAAAPPPPNNGGLRSPPLLGGGGADRDIDELPGIEIQTPAGPCLLYEERYPLDHRHGGVELGACLELPALAFACLAKNVGLTEVDLSQGVFLDAETTGLAGGTGTTAFLVGIAHFAMGEPVGAPSAFVIRQFFMRDFAEERAMLLALAEALEPFRYVLTFNGKSFDLPLLETRYVLARLARRWQPDLHFDLLHPARRLWRTRLEGCSLAVLEEAVLGHRRDADVPSWAIPGLYVAYLQRGDVGALRRVFSHNRHDLLSLAALATHLGRRLADPLAAGLGPDELLGVARLYEQLGLQAEARACLEAALAGATHGSPVRPRVQLVLALYCKRAGHRDRALQLWRELAVGPGALPGLIELAKHHEHQRRDPAAALEVVEQALAIVELREARDGASCWRAERTDLERRLARLLRKRSPPAVSL